MKRLLFVMFLVVAIVVLVGLLRYCLYKSGATRLIAIPLTATLIIAGALLFEHIWRLVRNRQPRK